PNGYTGFANATASSGTITLPSSCTYTLTVQGTANSTGSYSFDMVETGQTEISAGTPYSGTLAGTGQVQVFEVPLAVGGPTTFTLTDANTADHNELYVKFGSAPTLQTYDSPADAAGSGQTIVVPSAAAGDWYILVYSEY